ncbi:hypothetical protein FRZ67_00680 [Panacibacter ginsenosidivorans]|uniref:DUF5050 domain-containing protein n=1 Tax=Panacibacter ginsenosidivorans TaxID=1813871 RepID=A0A5B8V5K6_9BACT|nr:hypothetical protein [Panacibacter ginsenosidivorans]QEC65886.1 hypothetical protein FRZ67_00680 [Panacibacter ginsenosidivorans]
MKKILWIFLLAGFTSSAQSYTLDTLFNATAYANSFLLLPFTGTTNTGSKYIAGFNQQIDKYGNQHELEIIRIDLTTGNVTNKKLTGFTGGKGYYWNYTFDKYGSLYLSMYYPTRKVLLLDLTDSIAYKDLGNPFINASSVIYSLSPGRDGHIYFGASGGSTCWSEYDPVTKEMKKHPSVDADDDYLLSIAGDDDYAYMQTGQRKSINLWSVNKRTNEKKLLFSVSNKTRYNLSAYTDAVYVSISTDTLKGLFKLSGGEAIKSNNYSADSKIISGLYEPGKSRDPKQVFYFNPLTSQVYFSMDKKKYDSVYIQNIPEQMSIRRMFSFPNDKDNIYYAGDYYGNYYRYNFKEQKAYLLGSTDYNIYSSIALNDSMIYLSGYPSGYLMLWNKNQPWTTNKFIDGKMMNVRDPNANPKIIHYWKSEGSPAAGFHHTYQMLKDSKGNIIGAGDVIRIGNAASIGVYNANTNKIYGIDYEPFTGLGFAGIAMWKDLVLYSMRSKGGTKKSKIYFYDPALNKMVDSIDLGFNNYGKILIQNNMLTGVADNKIYRISLPDKKLQWSYTLSNTINGFFLLSNGRFVINTVSVLPAALKDFISLPINNYYEANSVLYAIAGNHIIRIDIK